VSGLGIQDAIAAVVVAGAVAYLVRRRLRRRAAACGACEGCAAPDAKSPPRGLLEIEPPRRRGG
jgi:hypothetical protein